MRVELIGGQHDGLFVDVPQDAQVVIMPDNLGPRVLASTDPQPIGPAGRAPLRYDVRPRADAQGRPMDPVAVWDGLNG